MILILDYPPRLGNTRLWRIIVVYITIWNNGILVVNNVSSIIFKLQKRLSNESVSSNALIHNVNSWLFSLIFVFQKNQVDSQKAMLYPTESYALLDAKHRDIHHNSPLYPFTCRFLIFSKPIIIPSTEPTVAPLQSVSKPVSTDIQMDLP